MSKTLKCDCCDGEIVRKRGVPSGRVSQGKGNVEFRPSLRRRFTSWLFGPLAMFVWGDRQTLVGGEWKRRHICNDCYEQIRNEIK